MEHQDTMQDILDEPERGLAWRVWVLSGDMNEGPSHYADDLFAAEWDKTHGAGAWDRINMYGEADAQRDAAALSIAQGIESGEIAE